MITKYTKILLRGSNCGQSSEKFYLRKCVVLEKSVAIFSGRQLKWTTKLWLDAVVITLYIASSKYFQTFITTQLNLI